MKKYRIIADSCCDLKISDYFSEVFDFITVPICINVGETSFVDDESFDTRTLIAALKPTNAIFKTAAPSPEVFAEEMRKGDNVICVTLSSKLSGTYNSARIAAKMVKEESPQKNIYVLDSLSASSAMAVILYKLKALLENSDPPFSDVVKKLEEWSFSTRVRFVLQDFGNLVKTGRMSKLTGFLASALPVKLICGDNGAGEIKMCSKTMGTKNALKALADFPHEKSKSEGKDIPIILTHCHNETDVGILKTLLNDLGFNSIKTFLMRGIATVYASDKGISIAY